jgi:hypothetical protein
MSVKRIAIASLILGAWLALASQAAGAPGVPVWRLTASSQPTNFTSGEANDGTYPLYDIVATNVGGAATSGPFTVTDTLPAGVTPTAIDPGCIPHEQTLTCTSSNVIVPGQNKLIEVRVKVGALPEGSILTNEVKISDGGAPEVSASSTTEVTPALPEFGFLGGPNGLSASFNDLDGSTNTQAGSHPDQLTVDLGFPSRRLGGEGEITGVGGGLRDLTTDLPRGFLVNPNASPVLCSEAQLEGHTCPNDSAVGIVTVLTTGAGPPQPSESPLYNMIAPAGTPAELGFDAAGVGIFVHLKGGVRNEGDYGLSATTNDTLARAPNPVLGAQAQLWGDPSAESHDHVRGECDEQSGKETVPGEGCPVTPQETAFLTLPSGCSKSLTLGAAADSWIDPGKFVSASAPITDANGTPVGVDGCGNPELEFKPTIEAKPTTNLTDSPSGLDIRLHQPQELKLGGLYTPDLEDATITLPEGLVVNPSQANGLGACTIDQVGLATKVGQTPIAFSKAPANCPNAAKLGSVSVSTPLLGHALPGAIYIAKPFQNPFGSLLAVYLTIDDTQTGTVAKLAGRVTLDPVTGRLSTRFTENPELPLEDVQVDLFGGDRAPLRTPPACNTYTTSSDLTPWSAPEGEDAHPTDSFAITAAPGGGACPSTASAAPNKPSFEAGTVTPKAGAYSPFVLKLSRPDGSQPAAGFEATLPQGLTAKLAGVPACSQEAIAQAQSRSHPNEGAIEQATPSCPAASEIGAVDVAAGAGPTPLNVPGHVYMAGPYKGAPLSAVIITPAIAGPFDLGAVVVRAAIYLDRDTALVRTVSDPLPTILEGIPLDLRSATVRLGRPQFTLNPTSCAPKSVLATVTSLFGQPAALSSPFQVGGCEALPFGPKLHTRLSGPIHRGGHPRLRAVFEAKPGEANSARIVFALPKSEFIDQAHFRTICTRVQFAANQCPPGSVYGHVKAITPLLDYTLEGPIYLRSSSHELPDVVAALRGPPSQPIEIDLDGRVDSVNGGVRTTFEQVPDAPVSKVIVSLLGAKKGLFQNSTNICKGNHSATLKLTAQSGKFAESKPQLKADCGKSAKKKKK